MIWRQPFHHATDCYFCVTKKTGIGRSNRWKYAEVKSVTFPVVHSEKLPIPKCPSLNINSYRETSSSSSEYPTRSYSSSNQTQHHVSQAQLNDLVRDLELTKDKAELLASRMKQYNVLAPDVIISYYRVRDMAYNKFYTTKDNICFCKDIPGLFKELNHPYNSKEWRLFIDSSKESLKGVLLHNGNEKPSIPIAHAVNTKESYETMAKLLKYIKHEEHDWKMCCDLKVVAMLCGLQGGYTKYCCFLCLWDSRAREDHYKRKEWPKREHSVLGENNIKYMPLVQTKDIILPPLHIKLGLFKNFVKALSTDGNSFFYLKNKFKSLSTQKIKEGVFDGPQIRKLINDEYFESCLSSDEIAAWTSFKLVVSNFLGCHKSPFYKTIVEDLIKNYEKIGKN